MLVWGIISKNQVEEILEVFIYVYVIVLYIIQDCNPLRITGLSVL